MRIADQHQYYFHGDIPCERLGMTSDLMDLLLNLALSDGEQAEYWATSLGFVWSIAHTNRLLLTERQEDWIYGIIASLIVQNNRLIAIEVFTEAFGASMGHGAIMNKGSMYRIPFSASKGGMKFN